ncbi:MAG: TerC family protein [Bdellovibrionales bacterium]|nr:TerC family protein [Bdellovibrionales bacterium]
MVLFPFAEYWWLYAAFTAFVLLMLTLDLGVFHRKAHEVSFREATTWSVVWVGLAMAFNYLFYLYAKHEFSSEAQAKQVAFEFLTGYVVEKSLAIDNIFVFTVVFTYFGIPKIYHHRVLFWGILGALIFRAIFIALGSVLMEYEWILVIFGSLLILTGAKMFFTGTEAKNLGDSLIVKTLQRFLRIHPQIEGQHFLVRQAGTLYVTPLFLALVFLELTDIVFAIDSVPAIFSITREPLIVFSSNMFAILGLRSMYFMLAGTLDRFVYIKYGLASVLIFVGLKMICLNDLYGGKFPINWSLAIIGILIGGSILISMLLNSRDRIKK